MFVHGAGAGGWEWAIWAEVFGAHGYACRAPDLHPRPMGLASTGFGDYLDQLDDWILGCSGPQVVVAASLGALLTLCWLQRAEAIAVQRISRLVLLNPHPALPEAERMPPPRFSENGVIPWGQRSRLQVNGAVGADEVSALRAFRGWRDESACVLAEARQQRLDVPIQVPCLWLASQDDEDVPVSLTESLAKRLGGESMRLQADHISPLIGRGAARTAGLVLSWLSTG
nr:alpha/beta fold hydrolase [Pseudomarimonas arenosa]